MKEITVAVPYSVYRIARIRAAERGLSVSALVAEYLGTLGTDGAEFERLEAQQRAVIEEITQFRAGDRLGREELHRWGSRIPSAGCFAEVSENARATLASASIGGSRTVSLDCMLPGFRTSASSFTPGGTAAVGSARRSTCSRGPAGW